jgi:hypothetical protein
MSSHQTENTQQEHSTYKCPECGVETANLPNHMNSRRCNVRQAVVSLYADGTRYVKSKDVAEAMGKDASQGDLSTIGAALNNLDVTEKWADGHSAITWRLTEDLG